MPFGIPPTTGENLDVSRLLSALEAVRSGDFTARLPQGQTGLPGQVADAFNQVVEMNERLAAELARVVGAAAKGDLSQQMVLEIDDRPLEGEFLRTAKAVNRMMDQLDAFAGEVTRVAREVGLEGRLGGQARVQGVAGSWRDVTESVNLMASNLTGQVRHLAEVTTAVANGDLSRMITMDAKGEVLEVKSAINTMVDQLRSFASEALTSKCTSEFLANVSHELRTPLNSLLILSDQLSRNSSGNLSEKETEFAKTIHASGNDLLNLINDILDLSKIESGTVVVDLSELRFDDLRGFVERTFNHVAESKNLEFVVDRSPDLPSAIRTDAKRLQQILRNMLSNAFKFTRQGRVSLAMFPAPPTTRLENELLRDEDAVIAFRVSDTGIGIPLERQQIVFEAFQQADGSTSRKYGGTGLGLAISRELSWLLGGEIHLESAPGEGSVFTLYLPGGATPATTPRPPVAANSDVRIVNASREAVAPVAPAPVELVDEAGDDRGSIVSGDRVLLIVEDDTAFARRIFDAAHDHGYKALITGLGATALSLTEQFRPHAIMLDVSLPDIHGWRVLDRLKHAPHTRHIPVYIITTDGDRDRALRAGALGVATNPIETREQLDEVLGALHRYHDRETRTLLLIEPDAARRQELHRYLPTNGVRVLGAATAEQALEALAEVPLDCVILNPSLPDATPADLVDRLVGSGRIADRPVLVHGSGTPTDEEALALERLAQSAVVKEVKRPERLLDLAALFLHRRLADLPDTQRQVISDLHEGDKTLAGRKVLIVDDDIRNIFALTSVLERHQMVTLAAETGRDAIAILERTPDIDVVLMDVMMPEMDGLDTTRAIRKIPRFRELPIIAVTAKAMKGDREKCLEAGAWDYLAKPVDPDELVAMLRAWLVR